MKNHPIPAKAKSGETLMETRSAGANSVCCFFLQITNFFPYPMDWSFAWFKWVSMLFLFRLQLQQSWITLGACFLRPWLACLCALVRLFFPARTESINVLGLFPCQKSRKCFFSKRPRRCKKEVPFGWRYLFSSLRKK